MRTDYGNRFNALPTQYVMNHYKNGKLAMGWDGSDMKLYFNSAEIEPNLGSIPVEGGSKFGNSYYGRVTRFVYSNSPWDDKLNKTLYVYGYIHDRTNPNRPRDREEILGVIKPYE